MLPKNKFYKKQPKNEVNLPSNSYVNNLTIVWIQYIKTYLQ